MEIRPIAAGRRGGADALLRTGSPRPTARSSRRTSTIPTSSPSWARPGAARVIAVEDGEVVGSVAVVPLHGWSSHVGEVRLVVDPEHRGRGIGRALARQAVLEAMELVAREARRRGDRRPGVADRDVPRARLRARGAARRPRPRSLRRGARPDRAGELRREPVRVDGRRRHRGQPVTATAPRREERRTEPSSGSVADWVQPVLGRRRTRWRRFRKEPRQRSWPSSGRCWRASTGGTLLGSALPPWGGAEACIDAYEDGVRAATDVQLTVARALDVEPARSLAATCVDLTRDIGATQLSSARWLLDV